MTKLEVKDWLEEYFRNLDIPPVAVVTVPMDYLEISEDIGRAEINYNYEIENFQKTNWIEFEPQTIGSKEFIFTYL